MVHGHRTPHSVSPSRPTHPVVEDAISSHLKGRRKEGRNTHTHTHTPRSPYCLFRSQTLSWLCSPPTDQRLSRQEGVGENGELRIYLATLFKQTTNWQIFFLKVISTPSKYTGNWVLEGGRVGATFLQGNWQCVMHGLNYAFLLSR